MSLEDSFLSWLSTTRAKSKMAMPFLNNNESQIIQILGGVNNILNIVLSNKTFLDNKQFSLLSCLFKNEIKRLNKDKKAKQKDTTEDTKLAVSLAIESLPIDLTSYLCTFLDIKSLIQFEKVCYHILFIARKPSSLYQIDPDIMENLNKYQTSNKINLDLYRFTKAKKVCITASKQTNNTFLCNVIHKIAKSSMLCTHSINELYLNSLNTDNKPFHIYFKQKFSVKKLLIKDSDISFILNKCFDVQHLELIDSALDAQCIPFLFENKNRNHIKHIVFHDYQNNDDNNDDIYLMNQNGLFLKEFNGMLVNSAGNKFSSIQCEGNLNLTKYFLYNILKLSFGELRSLHIEELDLLNINEYGNIYENMTLLQLKELCFTCSVDENIYVRDDFVLNGNIKYFQTPNLERLNIEITSFTDELLSDNKNKKSFFNISKYLSSFGINKLSYLGINIEQNIDDDSSVLLMCLDGMVEYILHDDNDDDDGDDDNAISDIIKLNISAEWFGDIDFNILVHGIKNLINTVNDNAKLKLFVLSIGDLYFDMDSKLINDLRENIFVDIMSNNKWNIMEDIVLFGNNTVKIIYRNKDEEIDINWISQCHCCERPAFI